MPSIREMTESQAEAFEHVASQWLTIVIQTARERVRAWEPAPYPSPTTEASVEHVEAHLDSVCVERTPYADELPRRWFR